MLLGVYDFFFLPRSVLPFARAEEEGECIENKKERSASSRAHATMLPVAGISPDIAHDILTGLRAAAAAAAEQERESIGDRRPPSKISSTSTAAAASSSSSPVPERWLDSLLLAQLSADALHRDAERARRALAYWRRAAAEGSGVAVRGGEWWGSSSWGRGSHSARLLLRSGPREALRGLGRGASRVSRGVASSLLFFSASERKMKEEEEEEEEKAGGGGGGAESEKENENEEEDEDPAAAVDARVKELALLCSELERALCRVHLAAGLLTMDKKNVREKKGGRGQEGQGSCRRR